MKKLIVVLLLLVVPVLAKADAVQLPPLKQGFAYSLIDNKLNYLATADILSKWGFTLAAGYAGRAQNTGDKAVVTVDYAIGNLQRWIDVPIAKYVDLSVGVYAGLGNVQVSKTDGGNEFDWGLSAKVIQIKF